MNDEATFPRADIEYFIDALENAYNLSLTHDLQTRILSLNKSLRKSKLTIMLEACIDRLETSLKDEDDQPNSETDQ